MLVTLGAAAFAQSATEQATLGGTVSGVVIDAISGEPIEGAYVGLGDFGDAGGANHRRHEAMGLKRDARTDAEGRFALERVASLDEFPWMMHHALFATHPDYVRRDCEVVIREGAKSVEVRFELERAARIEVVARDPAGAPLTGLVMARLERLDGRPFIPPGRDPHLSSFASSGWAKTPAGEQLGDRVEFTELAAGDYAVDVFQFDAAVSAFDRTPASQQPIVRTKGAVYAGGDARVSVEAGESLRVDVRPIDRATRAVVRIPRDNVDETGPLPFGLLLSRRLGLELWDDGEMHGPEDHRFGRLIKNSMILCIVEPGEEFLLVNLPPGEYAVFGGWLPRLRAARMKVEPGKTVSVFLPDITEAAEASRFPAGLDRRLRLDAGEMTIEELCAVLNQAHEGELTFRADRQIAQETVALVGEEASIWDLLESVYLQTGCRVKTNGDASLWILPDR
jgi:hypothetical protein